MNIVIDKDKRLGYETNSVRRKAFNIFFIPFLNIIPAWSNLLIRKSHKSVNEVVENATNHKALEVLYKKGHKKHTSGMFQKLAHGVWFNTNNSKAVRNRLRIVGRELTQSMKSFLDMGSDISILSIASGSARAIVESISNLEKNKYSNKISAIFLDKNPQALEYSKNLIKDSGLGENKNLSFSWENGTAGSFMNKFTEPTFDIIEMVGLLDYFDDAKAVSIFRSIRSALKNNGVFITANICDNSERKFMTNTINWRMVYRSAEELGNVLVSAGFKDEEIKLYYEPLKVHVIAVIMKK